MNLTSLSHPTIQARIYAAMRYSVNAANGMVSGVPKRNVLVMNLSNYGMGFCVVQNKNGKGFMSVLYERATDNRPSGFTFEAGGKDVTDVVIQSLRMN